MTKLINNEFFKIIKKNTFVISIIFILLIVLINNYFQLATKNKQITSINSLEQAKSSIVYNINQLTTNNYQAKVIKQKLQADYYILQYKIAHQLDNNIHEATANHISDNILNNYGLYYLILIIISGSSIMSDEIHSGTIKGLLTQSYSRWQIFLAKYLTFLIYSIMIIALFVIFEYLVTGFLWSFNWLASPSLIYNHLTKQLIILPSYQYLIINLVLIIPLVFSLGTLSYTSSILLNNKSLAILLTLLLIFMSEKINQFLIKHSFLLNRYLITLNWDLSGCLWGRLPEYPGITIYSSLLALILFNGGLLFMSYIKFKHQAF